MKSTLHHGFDPYLAAEYGMVGAVLIHHFQFWIQFNVQKKKNLHDERTWTYQTLEDIAAHFVYLSQKQVERTINKLVKAGVIIKGNYNHSAYDRTVWYAFKDQGLFIKDLVQVPKPLDIPESGNQNPGIGTPIPDPKAKILEKTTTSPEESSSSSTVDPLFKEKVDLLAPLPMNADTKNRSMKFTADQIRVAMHNTKIKNPDDYAGYFFDQLKHGHPKKLVKKTKNDKPDSTSDWNHGLAFSLYHMERKLDCKVLFNHPGGNLEVAFQGENTFIKYSDPNFKPLFENLLQKLGTDIESVQNLGGAA